jgi:hypothetical protein
VNIKKITGGLAAALSAFMLSSVATAATDYTISLVASEIEMHAGNLVCRDELDGDVVISTTTWFDHEGNKQTAPVWQHKGKVGDFGCVVHASLVKQLFVERDEYDPNTMPPYKGAKTAKGNNVASGAANDLVDGKFDSAIKHICTFIDVIENNARLNTVDNFTPTTAYELALGQADTAKGWLYDLDVDPTACYEILGY